MPLTGDDGLAWILQRWRGQWVLVLLVGTVTWCPRFCPAQFGAVDENGGKRAACVRREGCRTCLARVH